MYLSSTLISVHAGQAVLLEFGFEEMSRPPYSPDLVPGDYHLFPNLKNTSVDTDFQTMTSSSMQPKSCWRNGQNFSILQTFKNSEIATSCALIKMVIMLKN